LVLTIRALFVCAFVLIFAVWAAPVQQLAEVSQRNLLWLGLSGITTTLSWIFYYKALKLGRNHGGADRQGQRRGSHADGVATAARSDHAADAARRRVDRGRTPG